MAQYAWSNVSGCDAGCAVPLVPAAPAVPTAVELGYVRTSPFSPDGSGVVVGVVDFVGVVDIGVVRPDINAVELISGNEVAGSC